MTTELLYLTYIAVFTALMWLPYILNTIVVRGIQDAVSYPQDPKPLADWAVRLKAAHYNAIENLVVFAVLVAVAHMIGLTTLTTIAAAKIYFYARIVHAVVYAAGIPWLRTLAFAVSWLCILVFAAHILSA